MASTSFYNTIDPGGVLGSIYGQAAPLQSASPALNAATSQYTPSNPAAKYVPTSTTAQPSQPSQPTYDPNNYKGWDPAAAAADFKANPNKFSQSSAPQPYTDPSTGRVFPSYDSFVNEVNNVYGDVLGAFDTTKQNLLDNKQTYLDASTSPFAALQPGIDSAYQQGQALNTNQVNQTQQANQSALGAARNLFNELSQGQFQRFGGSSSAGDFAQAYLGKGLQQQMGTLQSTLANNLGSLGTGLQNLTTQHTQNINQLQAEMANASAQAQKDFQDRLDAIDAQKNAAIGQKANLKLQALSDLRNTASQLAAQFQQAQLNAGTAHQASLDALRNSIAGFQAYAGKPIDLSAYNQAASPLTPVNPIQLPQITGLGALQGSTGNSKIDPYTGLPIAA